MAEAAVASTGSQTLSRGIRILEVLAKHGGAMTFANLVEELQLHRSIIYRLMRTLEDHRLVTRDEHGLISLGHGLAVLAASVEQDLREAAMPALRNVADSLASTCFIVGCDRGEITTLLSVAPHRSIVAVAQNPGTVHPLGIGAPGRAILSQLPSTDWPATLSPEQRRETANVIADGFAVSHDEVIPGLHAVAVPLPVAGHVPLALGVVCLAITDPPSEIAAKLHEASTVITAALPK